MVQREGLVDKLDVRADGNGQVGHAGSCWRVSRTGSGSRGRCVRRWRRRGSEPRRMTRGWCCAIWR
jgi:hypothetical protein